MRGPRTTIPTAPESCGEPERGCLQVLSENEVPEPDVVTIRGKTGLSQPAFAKSIGIPLGTLKNWEQGRRRPEGSARVLLTLIEKRPSIVQDELGR